MSGIVKIHGKEYKPVALRVTEFIKKHENWAIETDLISHDDATVIIKAVIKDEQGRVRGTGYAEETRASSTINKTSALENCETSAIGRALASIGLAGTEYASANEVSNAIIEQKIMEAVKGHMNIMECIRKHISSIASIKKGILHGDYGTAQESLQELTDDEKKLLWIAPSKGGVFTTKEREIMRSTEFREGVNLSAPIKMEKG